MHSRSDPCSHLLHRSAIRQRPQVLAARQQETATIISVMMEVLEKLIPKELYETQRPILLEKIMDY